MPTNRTFLANFLAAFRAHSTYQKPSPASTSPGAQTALSSQTTHLSSASTPTTNPSAASNPRSIASKAANATNPVSEQPTAQSTTTTTTYPLQAASSHLHPHTHPHSHAHPLPSTSPLSRSPGMPSSPRGRQRRGSDSSSSSGGFRDALGPSEKWYIGGRTAQGEERFYKLGMVTAGTPRQRSIDRLSL